MLFALAFLAVAAAALALSAIKVVRAGERGVVYRLGRVAPPARGPGLVVLMPFLERLERVVVRPGGLRLPPTAMTTRDEESLSIEIEVRYEVSDPVLARVQVADHVAALATLAESVVRARLSQLSLGEFRDAPGEFSRRAEEAMSDSASTWGVTVSGLTLTRTDRFRAAGC
ncbi:MAG: SPFH domain-containing protein [Bryobacteraceae bacterium]|nr:SPFH domain-containing protein [Bryobacteraceae bacterium]